MADAPTEIANLALDEIASTPIQSLSDNTHNAKVCARQYPIALAELLGAAEWAFARKRQQLVQTTNPRDDGGYAYALPNDLALPLRLVPVDDQTGAALVTPFVNGPAYPFEISNGLLFTRMAATILEYVTSAPDAARLPPLFRRALVSTLAAKIVYPITKDAARRNALLAEAELFRNRAIANEMNRSPATYGNFIPSVIMDAELEIGALEYGLRGY